MSANLPDFEKAEYTGQSESPPQITPGYEFRGAAWQDTEEVPSHIHAIYVGVFAAGLGSVAYAAFGIITHINFALIGIVIGSMIAGVMMSSTDGRGGRTYQIVAAVLTYLSISMAEALRLLWALHSAGKDLSNLSARTLAFLAVYGIGSPFFALKQLINGLFGLLILFFSIQAAWRVAGGRKVNR